MIKNRLPVLLAERDMKLKRFARESNLSYSALWNFTKGRSDGISRTMLATICKTLEVQPGDILTFEREV